MPNPLGIHSEFNSRFAFSEKYMPSRYGDKIKETLVPDF